MALSITHSILMTAIFLCCYNVIPLSAGSCFREFRQYWKGMGKITVGRSAKNLQKVLKVPRHPHAIFFISDSTFQTGSMYELQQINDIFTLLRTILKNVVSHNADKRVREASDELRFSLDKIIRPSCVMKRNFRSIRRFKHKCIANVTETALRIYYHLKSPGKRPSYLPTAEQLCQGSLLSCNCYMYRGW